MVEIRAFAAGDERQLETLFAAVDSGFEQALSEDPRGPSTFLADPSAFALGAYIDRVPVALAWGLQMRHPSGRLTTYLHQLEVREGWRRRGVATALTLEAMALARSSGSTRFWLSTGGHNDGAQALYAALGGDRKPLGDVNYWWQLD